MKGVVGESIPTTVEQRIENIEQETREAGRASSAIHRDWSEDLGSGATAGANQYPAKFSFNITTANCGSAAQPDYVAFNTSVAPGAPVAASATGKFSNKNSTGDVTVDGTVLTASTTINTGTHFQTGTSTTTDATNLAAAINRNLTAVMATSSGATVTLTAATAGTAGNSIALAAAETAFTWSGTTLANGTNGQASVMAFDNLYSGCSGTVPSTYWQYDTGGTVTTSITLSLDGSQLAFVQTQGGVATLVLLKWAQSSSTTVDALTAVSNSAYPSCTAPCMTTIAFHGNPTDTLSSPFYVYDGVQADTLYVGDDSGTLHKFNPVFNGTPAEVTSSWPIVVNSTAGTKLSGPVYDGTSGNIYMTDSTWLVSYVRDTGSTVGACTAPCKGGSYDFSQGALGTVAGGGAPPPVDSPIVDSTSETVFVFAGCTLAGDSGGSCGDGVGPAQVVQLNTSLTNPVGANVGLSSSYNSIHLGAFDNNYYSGSYSTGRMIVCGNPNRNDNPIMYVLSFNASGALSTTAITGPTLATSGMNNECSPLTEIYNPNATGGAADWVFGSVKTSASPTGCAGSGCVMNFVMTAWQPSNAYPTSQMALDTNGNLQQVMTAGTSGTTTPSWSTTNGGMTTDGSVKWKNMGAMTAVNVLTAPGGTSGIIVDNTVSAGTLAGASQVYYTTLTNGTCATSGGTGGCAVQASQAALH
jgi:hypothetical protein